MPASKRLGVVCMLLGILCFAGALTFMAYNHWDESRAGTAAAEIVPDLEAYVATTLREMPYGTFDEITEMATKSVGSHEYIGVLSIPAIDLTLPVMNPLSDEGMKIAPGLYAGSYLDESMVIAGHNYERHFGKLPQLVLGDRVLFTDFYGETHEYMVTGLELLGGTEVEKMVTGDWDLTLFTCNYGGESRVTVRCSMVSGNAAVATQL